MTQTDKKKALQEFKDTINLDLAADGQRLRRTTVVQEFSEGPMPLPLRTPRVVQRNVDIEAWAREEGVLPPDPDAPVAVSMDEWVRRFNDLMEEKALL